MRPILPVLLVCCFALVPLEGAQAAFRRAEDSAAMMRELARRCAVHAKNDRRELALVTGRLFQTRFHGAKPAACDPDDTEPCSRADWYPSDFHGYLVETNRLAPRDRLLFTVSGFGKQEMHDLNFTLGQRYAFCAEETRPPRGKRPPLYTIHNFFTIYELAR